MVNEKAVDDDVSAKSDKYAERLDLIPFFVVLPFSPIVVSSFDKKEEYGHEEEYKNH
jgi:hypothetical protein